MFWLSAATISNASPSQYSFGVFPYLPIEKTEEIWSPLATYISQQLNLPVQLRSRASFITFRDAIENEVFDIAFMQPFDYTNSTAQHNYIPLARVVTRLTPDNNKQSGVHRAIFVTLKKNKNLKIADLKHKTIATPPATAAVTILGKKLLMEHGLIAGRDYKVSTHINHHSCLRQLIINQPIVCITAYPAFARFNTTTDNRLTIIATSNAIPSSLVAVHKRMPSEDQKKIKHILLNLENNKDAKSFLKKSHFTRFIPASDADYDVVRAMWAQLNKKKTAH